MNSLNSFFKYLFLIMFLTSCAFTTSTSMKENVCNQAPKIIKCTPPTPPAPNYVIIKKDDPVDEKLKKLLINYSEALQYIHNLEEAIKVCK